MLVNSVEVLKKAKREKYAVPSSNVFNLFTIQAVLEAAKIQNSPLIVSLAEVHLDSISIKECATIVKLLAEKMSQEIVLHFDHGFTKEKVIEAIDSGFTSVMIDGSSLPYDENVAITKEIVEYAHARNVSVEAEIGHVGGGESYLDPDKDDSQLTTVEEAIQFYKDTGVDSLAISIGTAHGEYRGVPHLDFERLSMISSQLDIPLVLHGGSGSGDENLNKAAKLGICKVNIFTDLANAARDYSSENYATGSLYDSCLKAKEGYTKKLLHYYEIFETAKGE